MATQPPNYPLFFGQARHALDGKNRTVMPAGWRPEDPAPLWLVPQSDRACLLAMPLEEFKSVPSRVNANANLEPEARQDFLDVLFAEVETVTPDKQGRFVIPEKFCSELKLRNEVVFAGADSKFKIWNVKAFDAFLAQRRTNIRAVGKHVQL